MKGVVGAERVSWKHENCTKCSSSDEHFWLNPIRRSEVTVLFDPKNWMELSYSYSDPLVAFYQTWPKLTRCFMNLLTLWWTTGTGSYWTTWIFKNTPSWSFSVLENHILGYAAFAVACVPQWISCHASFPLSVKWLQIIRSKLFWSACDPNWNLSHAWKMSVDRSDLKRRIYPKIYDMKSTDLCRLFTFSPVNLCCSSGGDYVDYGHLHSSFHNSDGIYRQFYWHSFKFYLALLFSHATQMGHLGMVHHFPQRIHYLFGANLRERW